MGPAWQQIGGGGAEYEEADDKEQRQDHAAEQNDHEKTGVFAPVAWISRYAMDKWLNHILSDARYGGCAA